jgi:hypothetical protein
MIDKPVSTMNGVDGSQLWLCRDTYSTFFVRGPKGLSFREPPMPEMAS